MIINDLITGLRDMFPHIHSDACLEGLNAPLFFIEDHEENSRSRICKDPEGGYLSEGTFRVDNPQCEQVCFLAIDKCLFQDEKEGKRCDFSVFAETTFCLVEIKNVKPKNRSKRSKEAIEQLRSTVEFFFTTFEWYKSYSKKVAIICFSYKRSIPIVSTEKQNDKFLFLSKYQTELMEGNQISF